MIPRREELGIKGMWDSLSVHLLTAYVRVGPSCLVVFVDGLDPP